MGTFEVGERILLHKESIISGSFFAIQFDLDRNKISEFTSYKFVEIYRVHVEVNLIILEISRESNKL